MTKHRSKTAYMKAMRPQDILMPVPAGLCCKPGGFHIDPVRPVERAVITHGHSDHARPGHGASSSKSAVPISLASTSHITPDT